MWHHGTRKKKIATDGIKCNEDTGHVIRLDLTSSCPNGSINSSSSLFQLVRLECPSLANLAEKLANLKVLHLGQVDTASTVPYALAYLSSLFSYLSLIAYCKENFLPSLGNLTKLNDLYLSGNDFSVEIRKLTQLHILRLAENQLEGSVPSSIFELRNLQALDLSDNNMSGTGDLNIVLLNMESLTALLLSSNKLSLLTRATVDTNLPNFTIIGEFPYFFAQPRSIAISGSFLQQDSWPGTSMVVKSSKLTLTNFSSMVPKCLGNLCDKLPVLKMQANNFHGIIPETFVNRTNLRMIDFDNNSLQGREPKSLANCVKLKFLNHGDSQITDVFPSWLGTLPEVEVLILKFNNFHGEIEEPQTAFEFPKHRIIDLSHNRFTAIILSDNNFVGEIPTSIANLKGLRTLNLSNNNLRGYIPSTLKASMILCSAANMSLLNNLTGVIPQATQFSTFTNDSFVGNPGLCGEPLPRKCENSDASPADDDLYSESVIAFGLETVLAGCASRTIIGVALGYIFSTKV
ncbi:hypothetical protein CICLE_v10018213mg [Citrus x clementina]|uniref:Leucine-rich repeat-containing N-terminal plant-type domain-containing protein n=1 Tax=Citrus clementina TaxID=85681 RepID=V4TKN6_CITCL|nr:hypothetical protein CICLE_v10018213mg [Citrus x clementina]